jgi:uncharacterized membrane protein YkvA (DUF1232 family)
MPTEYDDDVREDDFDDELQDAGELGEGMSRGQANRFYDRLRARISTYLERKGSLAGKAGEFLLLVPDIFMLLWRLVNDSRVSSKNKVMLGTGLAYYVFPLDLLPEAFMGPMGYVDDLVFAVFMLNRLLSDTDPEVLRAHWSGGEDVLAVIQRVLNTADSLVGSEVVSKLKKRMK